MAVLPIAPHLSSVTGIANNENELARARMKPWMHNPKNMRREGTVSLSSDLRVMIINTPETAKDIGPDRRGVAASALSSIFECMAE